ncbi:hypothetical protein [Rhodococcus sp. RD6.2]|uniref:hypothetical protein n=1 Tax=Rhodococcus sp. RD6.2 TaxID=260936 RepID=UPI00067948D6|nr:hypothetical protein [Rhodococcus sp. RD6.2]
MTCATKQTPTPEPVDRDTESSSPTAQSTALRLARASALGVAKGTGSAAKTVGALGAYLAGQGYALAKSGLTRSKALPVVALVDEDVIVASAAEPARRGRALRRVLVVGALGAAVAAGVAVWRLRRPEPAPVAAQPPSLRDFDAPEAGEPTP